MVMLRVVHAGPPPVGALGASARATPNFGLRRKTMSKEAREKDTLAAELALELTQQSESESEDSPPDDGMFALSVNFI